MRKLPINRTVKWSLIAVCAALALFVAPLALIMGSNLVGGLLDLVLNRRPTQTELIGDYKLNVPWGDSMLHIRPDGTFQQEITEQGKPARVVSGSWQAREDSNFVDVDFRPFGMVWDDDHEREINIYGINFYKPHLGKTYGWINDDLGEKYERQ